MLPCQWIGWGCTKSWEGTQPGQLAPAQKSNIPYQYGIVLSNKSWEAKKWVMGNKKCLNICLPMASSKWITYFALLVCAALLCLLNCLYLNHKFSYFCSFSSLPHPAVEQQVNNCEGLSCLLGLTHNISKSFHPVVLSIVFISIQPNKIQVSVRGKYVFYTKEKTFNLVWEIWSYWRQYSEGSQRQLRYRSIFSTRKGWKSRASSAYRRLRGILSTHINTWTKRKKVQKEQRWALFRGVQQQDKRQWAPTEVSI